MNSQQRAKLLEGIHEGRIKHRTQGGKELSYVEGWDIKATLIRIFGFGGFSSEVIETQVVSNDPPVVIVTLRLTLYGIAPNGGDAVYTESAAASSFLKGADAWDMAVKTAETDALKRAAINLGDQFGLSLYNNGSTRPVIIKTLDQLSEADND